MKIQINKRHLKPSHDFDQYVKRRLGFALGDKFDIIKRIKVVLSDINGPKGGNDKRCLIVLRLKKQPDIVIDSLDTRLQSAIDSASERAARAVVKRLSRLRHRTLRFKEAVSNFRNSRRDQYLQEDFQQLELKGEW